MNRAKMRRSPFERRSLGPPGGLIPGSSETEGEGPGTDRGLRRTRVVFALLWTGPGLWHNPVPGELVLRFHQLEA